MCAILQKGGKTAMGDVLVSDHIPKVKVLSCLGPLMLTRCMKALTISAPKA